MDPGQYTIGQKRHVILSSKENSSVILNGQNRNRCSRVLSLQEVSDLQVATSSSIAFGFEESNDEGSDTTVFRAWNTVSTSLHDQTRHRQTIWEVRI